MSYTPKLLRRILKSLIRKLGEGREEFVKRWGRYFTRPRTLTPFGKFAKLYYATSFTSTGISLAVAFRHSGSV